MVSAKWTAPASDSLKLKFSTGLEQLAMTMLSLRPRVEPISGPISTDELLEPEVMTDPLLDWIAHNPEAITPYAGKWLAFSGTEIIAASEDMREASLEAKRLGIENPVLFPVPTSAIRI